MSRLADDKEWKLPGMDQNSETAAEFKLHGTCLSTYVICTPYSDFLLRSRVRVEAPIIRNSLVPR